MARYWILGVKLTQYDFKDFVTPPNDDYLSPLSLSTVEGATKQGGDGG